MPQTQKQRLKRKRKAKVMHKQKVQEATKFRKEDREKMIENKQKRKELPDNKILKLSISSERPPCKKCETNPKRQGSAFCGKC